MVNGTLPEKDEWKHKNTKKIKKQAAVGNMMDNIKLSIKMKALKEA